MMSCSEPCCARGMTSALCWPSRDSAQRQGLVYDPFFLDGVAGDPALNQPDHIHPNATGVKRVVARIKPAVEQVLREVPAAS